MNIYIGMYIISNIVGKNSNCFNLAKNKVTSTFQKIKNQNKLNYIKKHFTT